MVSLSSSHITSDVIATGSSDGLIRVIQIHPSKFLGIIAEHGGSTDGDKNESKEGLPVERMKLDRRGKWLGSVSHDELLKLTDVEGALEGSDSDEEHENDGSEEEKDQVTEEQEEQTPAINDNGEPSQEDDSDSSEAGTPPPVFTTSGLSKKRRRKESKREEAKKRKTGSGPSNRFFDGL
jgi:hypothetical protein